MTRPLRFQLSAWTVFRKELVDALRDRRTLAVVLMSGVLLGPVVLIALSALIAQFEARADRRVVVVSGIEHAASLKNFFERQTYRVEAAPAGYEAQLGASQLADPVVVIPADFEAALLRGQQPVVEIVSDSANKQSASGAAQIRGLLTAYNRERATIGLALRGVAPQLIESMRIEDRELGNAQSRASQFTGILPFFVIMAVLYGALNGALDTTAGERERGSLEPLLTNPAHPLSLVIGKWAAVATLATLIALLSCFSFLPAQQLLRSDTLQAMFQFGLREALLFIAVLIPLAGALAAVLMAVAIRCRSFKEAQANSTVVILGISLLPLMTLFNQSGEAPWHLWVPALAQHTLMMRVLKGEELTLLPFAVPVAVSLLLTSASLAYVARSLRDAAVKS